MGSPSRYDTSPTRSKSRSGRYSRSRSPPRRYSRSRSPPRRHSRSRSPVRRNSRSPPRRRRDSRSPPRRKRDSSPRRHDKKDRREKLAVKHEWGRPEDNAKIEEEEEVEKIEPNFGLSGKLAAETNTVKGVELKYNEPSEAAVPKTKWRLYVFKGNEQIGI